MAKKMNKHQKRVANDIMKAMKTAGISWKEPLVFLGIIAFFGTVLSRLVPLGGVTDTCFFLLAAGWAGIAPTVMVDLRATFISSAAHIFVDHAMSSDLNLPLPAIGCGWPSRSGTVVCGSIPRR